MARKRPSLRQTYFFSNMLSKTCEHAIKAAVYITRQSLEGKRTNLKEIAAGIESPLNYTAKILQTLAKNEFVQSSKGVNGGFETSLEKMKTQAIMRIVEVFDGDFIANRCVLGLKSCSGQNPCPFHNKYAPVRAKLVEVFEGTTILDLALGLYARNSTLKK